MPDLDDQIKTNFTKFQGGRGGGGGFGKLKLNLNVWRVYNRKKKQVRVTSFEALLRFAAWKLQIEVHFFMFK